MIVFMGWSALPQSTPIQRSFLHDHIANFIGIGHVPTKVVVAGVDDEDITLMNGYPVLNHLACVDIVIPADIAQIDDCGGMDEKIHFE